MLRCLKAFSSAGVVLKKPVAPVYKLYPSVTLCTKVETHYDALGVTPDATLNDIKTAYYKLTLEYHPDRNPSEEAKRIFQKVSNAYEVLSNYEARKNYDAYVMVPKKRIPDIVSTVSKIHHKERPAHARRAYDPYDPISRSSRQVYSYALKEKLEYSGITLDDPITLPEMLRVERLMKDLQYIVWVCIAFCLYFRFLAPSGGRIEKQKEFMDNVCGEGSLQKRRAAKLGQ